MKSQKEQVEGLCHLVANEFDKRLEGDIIGLCFKQGIWHYAFRLPDGRVLDKHGIHESEKEFLEVLRKEWPGPVFNLVETDISEECINIFSKEEIQKSRRFALKIINRLPNNGRKRA